MTYDLFSDYRPNPASAQSVLPDAWLLRHYLAACEDELLLRLSEVLQSAPLQQMSLASGGKMSVQTSSCGEFGWISDQCGYRYSKLNPQTGTSWPEMPALFRRFAQEAAAEVGFGGFCPDSCLINCYPIGARMGLHQDRNERDLSQPIVSLSLGLPASFQFGGFARSGARTRVELGHGDLLVWGGQARMRFHGVLALKAGHHPRLGERRINLTFRKAG